MAYIYPQTYVKLFKKCPIDREYNHTYWFQNATAQDSYFATLDSITFGNDRFTYQRKDKGTIRVAKRCDLLYDCNYMMFENSETSSGSYSTKKFYAFIDSIEYVNDECSEIKYSIDVIQTWMFDFDFGECFIERQHSETDQIGDNLVPENLETGNLIVQNSWDISEMLYSSSNEKYAVAILYVVNNGKRIFWNSTTNDYDIDQSSTSQQGIYVENMYVSLDREIIFIDTTNTTTLSNSITRIDKAVSKLISISNTIVSMVQAPSIIFDVLATPFEIKISGNYPSEGTQFKRVRKVGTTGVAIYENYTPKNKKLYTNPYRNIVISNYSGTTITLNWEDFLSTGLVMREARLKVDWSYALIPELMIYPLNYRGIENDYESGITLTEFLRCAWSEDSFAKWWNVNKDGYISSLIANSINTIGNIALGVATGGLAIEAMGVAGASASAIQAATATKAGNAVSGGLSLGSSIANSVAQYRSAKNTPDNVCGQVSQSSLKSKQGRIGFMVYDMGIKYESAKIVDDYFTMFGYAIHEVKVPNIHARAYWTYVKTKGCIIHPKSNSSAIGFSCDDEKALCGIFDKGITFWTRNTDGGNPVEIGDYSHTNSTL